MQAAIDAVPAGNARRVTITVKPGTYRESVVILSSKPFIALQGLGSSASSTVIVNDKSAGQYGTNGSIYEERATGGPVTAAATPSTQVYGFLFCRSTVTGSASNVTRLGRPWGASAQVLYRESSLSGTIRTAQPWTDMGANSWTGARFLEYRNTGSGATVNGNRPQLSDSQAAACTPAKYLAGAEGRDPV